MRNEREREMIQIKFLNFENGQTIRRQVTKAIIKTEIKSLPKMQYTFEIVNE